MRKENQRTINNTAMLYLMTFAKLIFPLLTLPYLSRVLTESGGYAVVSYVKACMTYMQLLVDFGFILSAVKDIVKANGDMVKIGLIAGHVYVGRIILGLAVIGFTAILCCAIPLLSANFLFTMLSAVAVALSGLLADYLFRGLEKMHVVTIVFVVMKGIATAFTFVCVNGDADILWIPVLDIIGTAAAVAITWLFIVKFRVPVRFKSFKVTFKMLKESAVYFASNIATTAFGALNTVLIGIFIPDAAQISFWSNSLQIISAIQNLYQPINNGIYPQMVRRKSLKLIHTVVAICLPVVLAGTAFCFFCSEWVLTLLFGEAYRGASTIFRYLCPLLILGFFSMLYGWPTLGAVGKVKSTTATTVITAALQVAGLFILIVAGQFTLINIALLRCITEFAMMAMRMGLTYYNRKSFTGKRLRGAPAAQEAQTAPAAETAEEEEL